MYSQQEPKVGWPKPSEPLRTTHVSQPTTAIGSDVQPEQKTTSKLTSSKAPVKGGKQSRKHLSKKILR